MKKVLLLSVFFIISQVLSSCSYRLGSPEKKIPGGYTLLAVPVFKNKTHEVGIESFFTQALIYEIQRSSIATIREKAESQAIVVGEIVNIDYISGTEVTKDNKGFERLSPETILTKDYRVYIKVNISLYRSSDMALLWRGEQAGEKRYPAAVVTRQRLNTANPLYNQSAKIQNIQLLSKDMMIEAFDKMTENF